LPELTVNAVERLTDPAFTLRVWLLIPAGMVALAGTGKAVVLVLLSATETPPVAARLLSVTVTVAYDPEPSVVGLMTIF
jgi:hypothetical protein